MKWRTKNRLLVFLLAFVFTFGLAACERNDAGAVDEPVTTEAEPVEEVAEEPAEEVVEEPAEEVAGTVEEVAEEPAEEGADVVGDATDTAVEETEEVAEITEEPIGEATDAAGDAADATTDAVGDAADATTDAVGGAAGDANAELAEVRSQVVSEMEGLDLTDEAETNVLTVQAALTEARDNLATAYANGDEAAQAEWTELQQQFDDAEAALQDDAAAGLQQVQALLERLQQGVAQ